MLCSGGQSVPGAIVEFRHAAPRVRHGAVATGSADSLSAVTNVVGLPGETNYGFR